MDFVTFIFGMMAGFALAWLCLKNLVYSWKELVDRYRTIIFEELEGYEECEDGYYDDDELIDPELDPRISDPNWWKRG